MTSRFRAGGPIGQDSRYVERPADRILPEALRHGEFCHVFGPRQLGKTSLCMRSARIPLAQAGVRCAFIDLTEIITSDISADHFYFGLIDASIRELLGADADAAPFWQAQAEPPSQRWMRFLEEVVLRDGSPPTVIFIDEIDKLFDTGFAAGLLASLRSIHSKRENDSVYQKLSFCLTGVAGPWEFPGALLHSPLPISRTIELRDFTRDEANAFTDDLASLGGNTEQLLESIFSWTLGHPYMLQRIGGLIEQRGAANVDSEILVSEIAREFLVKDGRIQDAALNYAERHFADRNPDLRSDRVELYRILLAGEDVSAKANDPVQTDLWLAGMASFRHEGDQVTLAIRNRIFAEVFDKTWLDNHSKSRLG